MFGKKIIEEKLSTEIQSISPLSGGDINEVFLISCTLGKLVVKFNNRLKFPEMFQKEADGLHMLSESGIRTPEVVDHFEHDNDQYLILEYINEEKIEKKFWTNFAESLSLLHQTGNNTFGLVQDNYIGSLKQLNDQKTSWEEFFITQRLKPLLAKAFDQRLLSRNHLASFESFFNNYSKLVPAEPPALLHGDLWSGNLLGTLDQEPVFIDPAVYYGHREVDIAMTKMFGGFDPAYLDEYNEICPMEKGWEERISIHNLYPNLVHLVLFGRSYLRGIENILQRYA